MSTRVVVRFLTRVIVGVIGWVQDLRLRVRGLAVLGSVGGLYMPPAFVWGVSKFSET